MSRLYQPRVVIGVAFVGVIVLALNVPLVVDRFLMDDLVPNLILVDTPRATSNWKATKTSRGILIQASAGRYEGWYLDADLAIPQGSPRNGYEGNRYLVLSRRIRESSYWEFHNSEIRAPTGPFEGLYLDIAAGDEPISAGEYRFTRNLLIGHIRYDWQMSSTDEGTTVGAYSGGFEGWSLDYEEDVDSQRVWKRSVDERSKKVRELFGADRSWDVDVGGATSLEVRSSQARRLTAR